MNVLEFLRPDLCPLSRRRGEKDAIPIPTPRPKSGYWESLEFSGVMAFRRIFVPIRRDRQALLFDDGCSKIGGDYHLASELLVFCLQPR